MAFWSHTKLEPSLFGTCSHGFGFAFFGGAGIRIGFWDLLHVQEISLEGKGLFIPDDLEAMRPHGPGFGEMLWP